MTSSDDPTWEYFQNPANRKRALEGMTEGRADEILRRAERDAFTERQRSAPIFSGDIPHEPLTADEARELDRLLVQFCTNNLDKGDDENRSMINRAALVVRSHVHRSEGR
jgi:hypothetical protein